MSTPEQIRLSGTSYAVLGLVKYLGSATPYDLKGAIEHSIENFWPVPHTTFYAEPARLARAGYLLERQEGSGRRRKLYEITERGREALRDWVALDEFHPPQVRDEGTLKVFFGGDPARIYAARLAWHRAKLEELDGYLSGITAAAAGDDEHAVAGGLDRASIEGMRMSLVAGTTYHRMHIEAIEQFFAGRVNPTT
jgi:DNA-binding PadR family transcriptional regulator